MLNTVYLLQETSENLVIDMDFLHKVLSLHFLQLQFCGRSSGYKRMNILGMSEVPSNAKPNAKGSRYGSFKQFIVIYVT